MSGFRLGAGYALGGELACVVRPELLAEEPSALERVGGLAPGSDAYWMNEAQRESLKGVGITNPNPAVGCVYVRDGRELARGHTQVYRGRHAERFAFEKLCDPDALRGATAYVTLEPCAHQGNQPPCVELLAGLPVRRVVIGRADPDPRVSGRGIARLHEAGKEVSVGLLESEITGWNLPFFAQQALKRPVFALKWAQTLDGQLADDLGRSRWITRPIARSYTHWLRQRYDAILVGSGTFLLDLPKLDVRDCGGPIQAQPLRIVVDASGRRLGAIADQLLEREQDGAPWLVLAGGGVRLDTRRERDLARIGAHLFPLGEATGGKPLAESILEALSSPAVSELLGRPLQSVLAEGGPRLLGELVRGGLADVVHAFIAPILTGGAGYRVSAGELLAEAPRFHVAGRSRLDGDTLLELVRPELAEALGGSSWKH